MYWRTWVAPGLAPVATIGALMTSSVLAAQEADLRSLDGTWLFVEDRTEGRPVEQGGPPMSVRFELRVEEDTVVYRRSRGDERITVDGSVTEAKQDDGSIKRYRGEWKKEDRSLEYTVEAVRPPESEPAYVIKRAFRVTDDGGLLVSLFSGKGSRQVALYRHPEDIALPEPAKATIADMAWLSNAWIGTSGRSSIEERWSPPRGGAMLGVSRTVSGEKMTAFEYLRVVERDDGLVYVAQPGGRSPTEFALTELGEQRAVFVNPRHDYPQRIVYELSEAGVLSASIGFAKGRLQRFEFTREAK